MDYSTFIPDSKLRSVVECYWSVTGMNIEQQKIIPDGFPELIFHFGDPYEIFDDTGRPTIQDLILLSGQLSKPILLRPTGSSDVFGIKFKPAGLWKLFGMDMSEIKDHVISFTSRSEIIRFRSELQTLSAEERVRTAECFLVSKMKYIDSDETDSILSTIESQKGNISIEELCDVHHLTPRTLQRIFHQRISITAKQYARIIRFKTVYALLQKTSLTKADSVFLSGYFDQPHFNKEFRQFTQENPEKWFGENNSFSNFFMNR